jgi:DNA-binding response OmpR family regulator
MNMGVSAKHPAAPGLDLDAIYQGPARQRILIVDDDLDTLFLLKEIMRNAGFDVIGASSANEALKKCADIPPDIILLDLMMPDTDGWQTFAYLREMTAAPVIIVSAKSTKDDIVQGLQVGVDDYVTKPFFNAEVVARVNAVLRRARTPEHKTTLVFPGIPLVVNLETMEVSIRNRLIHLTIKEFAVLSVLAKQAPKTVHYETLAKEVWGEDTPLARKRLKYLIYLLRRKLEKDPANPLIIVNNEAYGYKLQTNLM